VKTVLDAVKGIFCCTRNRIVVKVGDSMDTRIIECGCNVRSSADFDSVRVDARTP